MRLYRHLWLLITATCLCACAAGRTGGVPAGTIVAFAGLPSALPAGWLPCNGGYLPGGAKENAALFAAIGYQWGGDEARGFRLPDLGGQFLRGVTADSTRDYGLADRFKRTETNEQRPDGGVGSYQLDATALPRSRVFIGGTNSAGAHVHPVADNPYPNRRSYGTLASGGEGTEGQFRTNEAGNHVHSVFINRGGDMETRPANASVYWIIKR